MLNLKEKNNFIHHIASKYLLGESIDYKVSGSKEQLLSLKEMMNASKELYDKINEDSPSLNEIVYLAEVKAEKAQQFKKLFGFDWSL